MPDKVPTAPLRDKLQAYQPYMRDTGRVTEGYDISRDNGKNQFGIDMQV
jgi:hypothetical protein